MARVGVGGVIAGQLRHARNKRPSGDRILDISQHARVCLQLVTREGVPVYKYTGTPEDLKVARSFGFHLGRCYAWTKEPQVARKLLAHATDECAAQILLACLGG